MALHAQGGQQTVTANIVLGVSGKPVRVFGYTQASGAGGPGLVQLFDGTSSGGQERWKKNGIVSDGVVVVFPAAGKFFPTGCFVQIDANVTYADFDYVQEIS